MCLRDRSAAQIRTGRRPFPSLGLTGTPSNWAYHPRLLSRRRLVTVPSVAGETAPLLVYDGDCSFCSSSARWLTAHWTGPQQAVAWQHLSAAQLERIGLSLDDVRSAAWWIDPWSGPSRGHLAIARALRAAHGWP